MMPGASELEQALLGGLLADKRKFADAAGLVRVDDFAEPKHAAIFSALLALDADGKPFDTLTVADALKSAGKLGPAGGMAYLAQIDAAAPTAANSLEYARLVADAAARRRLHELGERLQLAASTGKQAPADVAAQAERDLSNAVQGVLTGGLEPMSAWVGRTLDLLDTMRSRPDGVTGLASGLADLDAMTTGFHPGELIVVAARPGMGKTALAMGIAAHVACSLGQPVAFFSLEMPDVQLSMRLLASEARIPLQQLRTGRWSDYDMSKLQTAAERLYGAPIHGDQTAAITLFELRARSRRLAQKLAQKGQKLALVIVDYLQLMSGAAHHGSREQEVGFNSRGLKQVAKELGCPVIALAQLNRKVEERKDHPRLSDLRESGSIEQDADAVLFIHASSEEDAEGRPNPGDVEIVVAKQRNGPTGVVPVTMLREYTKFENRSSR